MAEEDGPAFTGFSFGGFGTAAPDDSADDPTSGSDHSSDMDEEEMKPPPPQFMGKRKTVSSEVIDVEKGDEDMPYYKHPDHVKTFLTTATSMCVLFSHLDDREIEAAITALREDRVTAGTTLIEEGVHNNHFYLIASGMLERSANGEVQKQFTEGQYVGEQDLMYSEPSVCTVKVVEDAVVYVVERQVYRQILTGTFFKKRQRYEGFLSAVPFMQALSKVELVQLADALQPQQFPPGEHLIRFEEPNDWMYLLEDGEVKIVGRDDDGGEEDVCTFNEAGTCLGELEFVNHHKPVADVVAVTHVRTAKLNRTHFEMCLGPMVEVLKRNAANNEKYAYYQRTQRVQFRTPNAPAEASADEVETPHTVSFAEGESNFQGKKVKRKATAFVFGKLPTFDDDEDEDEEGGGGEGGDREDTTDTNEEPRKPKKKKKSAKKRAGFKDEPEDSKPKKKKATFQEETPASESEGEGNKYFGGFAFGGGGGGGGASGDEEGSGEDEESSEEEPMPPPVRPAGRRKTVSSEVISTEAMDEFELPVHAKTDAEMRILRTYLEQSALFGHLEEREVEVAVRALEKSDWLGGAYLITQDDEACDRFYVVYRGEAIKEIDGNDTDTVLPGKCLGEMCVLHCDPPHESVRVGSSKLVAYGMDRHTYRHIVAGTFLKKRGLYEGFLSKVDCLSSLTRSERVQLADALQPQQFNEGEYLIRFDEEGDWMYLLEEGEVQILGRNTDGAEVKVCTFSEPGTPLGELEFVNRHTPVADVVATSGTVRTAKLNRAHFEMCMGPIMDVLKRNAEHNEKYSYYQQLRAKVADPAAQGQLVVAPEAGAVVAFDPSVQEDVAELRRALEEEREARRTVEARLQAIEQRLGQAESRLTQGVAVSPTHNVGLRSAPPPPGRYGLQPMPPSGSPDDRRFIHSAPSGNGGIPRPPIGLSGRANGTGVVPSPLSQSAGDFVIRPRTQYADAVARCHTPLTSPASTDMLLQVHGIPRTAQPQNRGGVGPLVAQPPGTGSPPKLNPDDLELQDLKARYRELMQKSPGRSLEGRKLRAWEHQLEYCYEKLQGYS